MSGPARQKFGRNTRVGGPGGVLDSGANERSFMSTEIVSIRLPKGAREKLKLLACERSLKERREVRWTALVRQAIEAIVGEAKPGTLLLEREVTS
jgi:hypothetical protein